MQKFNIVDFTELATLTRYMHVLTDIEIKFTPEGKTNFYIDLEAESIPNFIDFCQSAQNGLFEKITVLAKKIFYSDQERADNEALGRGEENSGINRDIETMQSLLLGLSEIGEYLSERMKGLSAENTFSKSELK